MKGITMTKEVKMQFDEQIADLKNTIIKLEQQFNSVKVKNNGYATTERLDSINPYWKMAMISYKNELSFREGVLKDATITD